MNIKLIKILSVIILANIPQFILTLFLPSFWWLGYIVTFVAVTVIHEPVYKWWDGKEEMVQKQG